MSVSIAKSRISLDELRKMAREGFGDMAKAVVDVRQEIMAVGGELHADEETALMEQAGSKREDMWGINLYPGKTGEELIEFDAMINLKPALGNRSRGVEASETREQIRKIVERLVSAPT